MTGYHIYEAGFFHYYFGINKTRIINSNTLFIIVNSPNINDTRILTR